MKGLPIVILFLGLVAGNFVYQALLSDIANYQVAFERSFFQGVAFAMLALMGHLQY